MDEHDIVHGDFDRKFTAARLVYYTLGILETLLAFRLVLKLLGANPASLFSSMIYSVTGVFLVPFEGIFRTAQSTGIETRSVLEPATVTAMIVYALIALAAVKLIYINLERKRD